MATVGILATQSVATVFGAQSVVAQTGPAGSNSNVMLVLGMLMFCAAGFGIVFVGLTLGSLARPKLPHPEKGAAYECGEPAIGDSWVQFDLRFYTVALVFIVFDVEVALLWPWAVAFKDLGAPGFWAFFVFFVLIAIPFMYEWKSGYLNWVRSSDAQEDAEALLPVPAPACASDPVVETTVPEPAGAGS